MFLNNSQSLGRHRLMFRDNRLSQNCSQMRQLSDYRKKSSNPFEDIIEMENNYYFVYDKTFLNKLKQLTKQLRRVFSTPESRSKSRNMGINISKDLDLKKKELIQKIKDNIKLLENQNTSPEVFTQSTQPLVLSDNHSDSESNSEDEDNNQLMYRVDEPLFTQQYIQSLNVCKNFRFSEQNYRILSASQMSSNYDSGFCGSPQEFTDSNQVINSQRDTLMSGQRPSQITDSSQRQIQIINRHKWTNTDYDIATGITLKDDAQNKIRTQRKRKTQLKFVLEKILKLIEEDVFCTKRDLYYQNVKLFDNSQRVVDEIIDDLASSLRTSRTKLRIVSSTRGLVFGHLIFQNTNGVLTDCLSSPNGINIPNDTERICRMESKAIFVLIIEKDATFQQLIDLKIDSITGHGYPDMNTRAFVQMLWNTFEIPIFGLVDGDAHGLEILCTFKHGSLALSYESPNLVAPVVKWLGVLPTDIIEYELSSSVQIDLSERDRKKIQDLKNRVYMIGNNDWNKQLDILLKMGKKVEIQSLAEHWPTFLLDVYLPAKIRYGKWI